MEQMTIQEASDTLRKHNIWRRDGIGEMVPPAKLGVAIDMAVDALNALPVLSERLTASKESSEVRAIVFYPAGSLGEPVESEGGEA